MLVTLAISGSFTLIVYVLYRIIRMVHANLASPLRHMRGPKSTDWITGNLLELRGAASSGIEARWIAEHGRTMKTHRFWGNSSVYTIDTKAIHHFLHHTEIYQKTAPTRYFLGKISGAGIVTVDGDMHRQQRRIVNPAFGTPQIRELTGIFVQTANQLRDIWAAQATQNGGVARVEGVSWLNKATLDIIRLAGFNHKINALGLQDEEVPDEFATAFETMLAVELTPFAFLQCTGLSVATSCVLLSTEADRITRHARATIDRISRQIFAANKRDLADSAKFDSGRARDLLTLLLRANTSKEVPVHQRLSDDDVLAQVPTFLVTGYETTSSAMTWALYALTQNTVAQTRLREEMLSIDTENPSMDQLNNLPYLDCVVRETLRLYAPVAIVVRETLCDDVVPLMDPWTDTQGNVHETLNIPKGTEVTIPIQALNLDPLIWGPNAREFMPERWESGLTTSIPGVWGHMMTFLGGPRGCVGYKFSVVEIKALLFSLIRAFEFELAVPSKVISSLTPRIVSGHVVLSEPEAGVQLPMLLRPIVYTSI
ncbi:cytochrome P450 [Mycena crocata]|nr:cytochrome P450 [Mycena crocata]